MQPRVQNLIAENRHRQPPIGYRILEYMFG